MKILLAASEAVPFCKTGGLADVVGTLAQKLGSAGHDVCLFLPKYREVHVPALQGGIAYPLAIPLGGETVSVSLRYTQWKSASVCFIDYPPFFDREGLYGAGGSDHPDNDRRFILFSRAILEGARVMGFKPDVFHLHDWQAALVAAYLKRHYQNDPFFSKAASLLTVHNIAYQGNFMLGSLTAAGFGMENFTPESFEYFGKFSFLKAGLVCSDLLSTVSPTYAREIQESPERGFGLEGLLKHRGGDLHGVINGIDLEVWNPVTDSNLKQNYSIKAFLKGKAACKADLQRLCGLEPRKGVPLFGVVSRFDHQKGLDIAIEALESRLESGKGCQLAVLGQGEAALTEAFRALARRHPESVYLHSGFDEPFAHKIYAGADLFLMPSRFEPCGLGHMIAMRYGTVPVASRTGGLADTVFEAAAPERPANGFLAAPGDAADLGRAIDRALAAYAQKVSWKEMTRAAMACDFSWNRSVEKYLELYRRPISTRGGA